MTAGDLSRGLMAGVVAGVAGGLFGVGGGILLIPLLTVFFGLSQHQAHGTSLGVISVAALASLWLYAWRGQVDWIGALLIAPSSMLLARWGARWAARTSPRGLRRAFAAFLVVVGLRLLFEPAGKPVGHAGWGWSLLAFDLGLGSLTGILAGYMGVGGGAIIVPALVLLRGLEQHLAQGTSLAVIVVTAPVAAVEHARHGNLAARWIVPVAAGAVIGGPLGAALAQSLSHAVLARAFALFLLVNAALTWRGAATAPASGDPSV